MDARSPRANPPHRAARSFIPAGVSAVAPPPNAAPVSKSQRRSLPLVSRRSLPLFRRLCKSSAHPTRRPYPHLRIHRDPSVGGFDYQPPDSAPSNPYSSSSDSAPATADAARLLAPRLGGTNLYLVGLMGSGKTAVGRELALRLGSYTFLDTDGVIEGLIKRPISEYFESEVSASTQAGRAATACQKVKINILAVSPPLPPHGLLFSTRRAKIPSAPSSRPSSQRSTATSALWFPPAAASS